MKATNIVLLAALVLFIRYLCYVIGQQQNNY